MKRFLLAAVSLVVLGSLANQPEFAWSIGTIPDNTPAPVAPASPINLQQSQQQKAFSSSVVHLNNDPTINVVLPSKPATTAPAASATKTTSTPATTAAPTHAYSGSGYRQDNLPVIPPATAYAPSFGASPCSGSSTSGGFQIPWAGLTGGHQRFDYGCAGERMGNLQTVGQQLDWAYQCQDDEKFQKASAAIGLPCPGHEVKQEPVTYNPPAPQPVPVVLPKWCAAAMKNKHPTQASADYIMKECVR